MYYFDVAAGKEPAYLVTMEPNDNGNATRLPSDIPIYHGVRAVFNFIRVTQGGYNEEMKITIGGVDMHLYPALVETSLLPASTLALRWPEDVQAGALQNMYYTAQGVTWYETMENQIVQMSWRDNRSAQLCERCVGGLFKDEVGNGACASCPAGQYRDAASQTCHECPAGTFSEAATGILGPDACEACPSGTYSADTGLTSRTACINCGAGTYGAGVVRGATSAAAGCLPCGAGWYG